MRFSTFKYLLKEGFKSMWLSKNMSLASVGVLFSCLILIGSAFLLITNINSAFGWLESQNVVLAYAVRDASDQDIETLKTTFEHFDNISNVEYISKKQVLEEKKKEINTLGDSFDDNNPFPDTFKLTVADLSRYDETVSNIKNVPSVWKITDRREDVQKLLDLRNLVANISVWIIALLIIISLFIIANTIKITMFVRQLEISIMKSVGATDRFITLPFMIEGILLGIFSAALATGGLWGIYMITGQSLPSSSSGFLSDITLLPFSDTLGAVVLIFLGVGVITGVLGSTISIRRFLKTGGGGIYDDVQ